MRPRIGLSSSSIDAGAATSARRCGVNCTYLDWVTREGGAPLMLPNVDPDAATAMLDACDALLLTGGDDVAPLLYGREPERQMGQVDAPRDEFELPLARLALERGMPILGICRGIQLLNVAAGGTLRQDLASDPAATVQHRMKTAGGPAVHHSIDIVPGSRLHTLVGHERMAVNSYHHQAVDDVADGFQATATSADGVIEALEPIDDRNILAVQWHPEVMPCERAESRALFAWLIEAAKG